MGAVSLRSRTASRCRLAFAIVGVGLIALTRAGAAMAAESVTDGNLCIENASLAELQQALAEGRTTSSALARAYLARIEHYDRAGPTLNSVREINPDAPAIAASFDRIKPNPRQPLAGIPIVVKDNIATGDKQHTTAGSLALAEARAKRDAALVARLRAAGAVIRLDAREIGSGERARCGAGFGERLLQLGERGILDAESAVRASLRCHRRPRSRQRDHHFQADDSERDATPRRHSPGMRATTHHRAAGLMPRIYSRRHISMSGIAAPDLARRARNSEERQSAAMASFMSAPVCRLSCCIISAR